jgi:hypothetical protein
MTVVFAVSAKLTLRAPPTPLVFTPNPEFLLRVGRRDWLSCGAPGEYDRDHSKQHRPFPPQGEAHATRAYTRLAREWSSPGQDVRSDCDDHHKGDERKAFMSECLKADKKS